MLSQSVINVTKIGPTNPGIRDIDVAWNISFMIFNIFFFTKLEGSKLQKISSDLRHSVYSQKSRVIDSFLMIITR